MNEDDGARLSELLKALGAGVRAVQALPLSSSSSKSAAAAVFSSDKNKKKTTTTTTKESLVAASVVNKDEEEDDDDDDDDLFAFEASFPEFSTILSQAQASEREVLFSILQDIASQTTALDYEEWDSGGGGGSSNCPNHLGIAELLELSATACEWLLEQVELYLVDTTETNNKNKNKVTTTSTTTTTTTQQQLTVWSQTARAKSQSAWSILLQNIVDTGMKPQDQYPQMAQPCNGRGQIFWPPVHPDKPFALPSSATSTRPRQVLVDGHGYEMLYVPSSSQPGGRSSSMGGNGSSGGPTTAAAAAAALSTIPASSSSSSSSSYVPSQHVAHYYQAEIQALKPTAWELEPLPQAPSSIPPPFFILPTTTATTTSIPKRTMVDTVPALEALKRRLDDPTLAVIAMDLEAHSYRSFAGMTCLIQLTLIFDTNNNNKNNATTTATNGGENYLLDPILLGATAMNRTLQAALANPSIVKIMHGADSDIPWLQRDFGLYIVHLWDTGRAARLLQFPSASYAYLLQRYCLGTVGTDTNTNNNDDKKNNSTDDCQAQTAALVTCIIQGKQQFQLSDWRQRPLPIALQNYAMADTHFLPYIAWQLKWELQQQDGRMVDVWETSRQISLLRYPGPPLFHPLGYQRLLLSSSSSVSGENAQHDGGGKIITKNQRRRQRGNSRNRRAARYSYTPLQEAIVRTLWDWRDAMARHYDESTAYICPNPVLLRLALVVPSLLLQQSQQQSLQQLPANLKLPNPSLESNMIQVIQQAITEYNSTASTTADDGTANPQKNTNAAREEDVVVDNDDEDDDDDAMDDDLLVAMDDDDDDDDNTTNNNYNREEGGKVSSKSSAFFKPTSVGATARRSGMMSPVLGTEALYQQAGWMTPQETTSLTANTNPTTTAAAAATTATVASNSAGEDYKEDDNNDDDVEEIHTTASEGEQQHQQQSRNQRRMVLSIDTSASMSALDLKAGTTTTATTPGRRGRGKGGTHSMTTTTTTTVDGLASLRAAREASKSPGRSSAGDALVHRWPTTLQQQQHQQAQQQQHHSLEEDVSAARQFSAQIRHDILESHHHRNVLGLLSSAAAAAGEEDDEEEDEEETEITTTRPRLAPPGDGKSMRLPATPPPTTTSTKAAAATTSATRGVASTQPTEEEFSIPRSMREIYKISNRNRRNKKTGSPTPLSEQGCATATTTTSSNSTVVVPTSNIKELAELEKAEALLQGRGMDAVGFLFTASTLSTSSSHPNDAALPPPIGGVSSSSSKQQEDDLSFFRNIGWIAKEESDATVIAGCYAPTTGTTAAATVTTAVAGSSSPSPMVGGNMRLGGAGSPPHDDNKNTTNNNRGGTLSSLSSSSLPQHHQQQPPLSNNPFFAGAALQGGPLALGFRTGTGGGSGASDNATMTGMTTLTSSRKSGGTTMPTITTITSGAVKSSKVGRGGVTTNNVGTTASSTTTTTATPTTNTERPAKRDGNRTHVYRTNR